jgi:uroporphyrin-III C-methyltransferase
MLSLLRKQRAQQEGTGRDEIEPRGPGKVFLVGTGPGDPDLLTLKAWKLMQTADLVLYDRLVSTDILEMVHADAPLLYVGKTSGYHSRTQEEIHELLLSFAVSGATVLRLKGGDPLVSTFDTCKACDPFFMSHPVKET